MRPKMITAGPLWSSLIRRRAPILLVLLMLGLDLAGDLARAALSYDRHAIESGEVWRVLTGNLVHLGHYHCALNALGLAALVALCPQPLTSFEWLRRLVLLGLGVSAGLYFALPNLQNYVGLSGVLHGLFVLGLVPMARRGDWIALGCLLYLLGKLAWESVIGAPVSDEQAIGGHVVTQAHLFGTLSGLVYGLVFGTFMKRKSAQ
ncbi:MAG: rhombosortase [Panacagrimonas sp.]